MHVLIVKPRADFASVHQQLGDRVDRYIDDTRDRPHGRPFAEHREDLHALGDWEPVHKTHYMNFYA